MAAGVNNVLDQVGVWGLKEAQAALRQLPARAKLKAQEAINVSAFQVAQGAKARAARRTGQLIGDIEWRARPASVSAIVGIAFRSFYWKFLEYGTIRMKARSFLRPAAEAVEADHADRLVRALAEAAEDVADEANLASGLGRFL